MKKIVMVKHYYSQFITTFKTIQKVIILGSIFYSLKQVLSDNIIAF